MFKSKKKYILCIRVRVQFKQISGQIYTNDKDKQSVAKTRKNILESTLATFIDMQRDGMNKYFSFFRFYDTYIFFFLSYMHF